MKYIARVLPIALAISCGGNAAKPAQPAAPAPAPTPVATPAPPPAPAYKIPVEAIPPKPDLATPWLAACRGWIKAARDAEATMLAAPAPRTIANTFEPYNELLRALANAGNDASLIAEVHPDPAVREVARTCALEAQQFGSELLLDKRAYDALAAVDTRKADAETQRFAKLALRDYTRAGVSLPDAQRARIKVIDEELLKTAQQFQQGIAEDTRTIEVKDAARLAGLPADWIAAHKPDDHGAIKITTDYPDYIPFITYAQDDELRKQLYVAFRLRGAAHNEEHLAHVLALRAEKAKLLGFKDWADYEADNKMLRPGKKAAEFIATVAGPAKARAKQDYAELLAELKTIDPKATAVADWQKSFLEQRVKQKKYDVDAKVVREYFSFDRALAGLLAITSQIYDIQYKPVAAADAHAWDLAVVTYDVMRGGEKLGRIYLDLHPREGKYKHAAQFPIRDGVVGAKDGTQLPEGALICNFPGPATDDDPGLMDHGDVVTMFHEFGHLMHHVLGGKHHWQSLSGVATEADFVEAPSQMFEEWGWRYETLAKFATHYKTGEVIPQALVAKMRKAYTFGRGSATAQQMLYAALSLRMHQVDPKTMDPAGQVALVKQLQAQYTPFAYVEGTKFHTSFGHLMGYSSRYYTYMWSLAIAKDLLTAFAKPGLLDAATTARYRDKVLAPGGSKDAADLVKDFLGRPYNFQAFEKYLAEK